MYLRTFQVLLIISLLFHVTACNKVPETSDLPVNGQTQARITHLSKNEFTYGDTLFIFGKNFFFTPETIWLFGRK